MRVPGFTSWAYEPDELSTWRDAISMAGPSLNGPGALGRPVYYALQHVILAAGPGSPLSLRLPALVFGLLGVWLTWLAARRLFGDTAGIVAGLLIALSPWHQYASVFARYWTLVYLLSLGSLLLLIEGRDRDDPATLRWAAVVFTLGALTHPTFLFPMVGVLLALHLVGPDGQWGWRWPSRAAWINLWIPFLLVFGGWVVFLKLSGNSGALSNFNGRGLGATLAVFAGMAEWATLPVVGAAVLGAVALARATKGEDRRWAAVAIAGVTTGTVLLFFAGRSTDVYADYGMAMVPLVMLTIGGAAERLVARLGAVPAGTPWATGLLAASAAIPGVVSNLRDGMRFDFRPAYAYLETHGAGHVVLAASVQLQRRYGPDTRFAELSGNRLAQFDSVAAKEGGFWLLLGHHRNDWSGGDPASGRWVDQHCRVFGRGGPARFDYREYWVTLSWCGSAAP